MEPIEEAMEILELSNQMGSGTKGIERMLHARLWIKSLHLDKKYLCSPFNINR